MNTGPIWWHHRSEPCGLASKCPRNSRPLALCRDWSTMGHPIFRRRRGALIGHEVSCDHSHSCTALPLPYCGTRWQYGIASHLEAFDCRSPQPCKEKNLLAHHKGIHFTPNDLPLKCLVVRRFSQIVVLLSGVTFSPLFSQARLSLCSCHGKLKIDFGVFLYF